MKLTIVVVGIFLSLSVYSQTHLLGVSNEADFSNDKQSFHTVASLSCSLLNTYTPFPARFLINAELRTSANGYQLMAESENNFFPSTQYEATSIKAGEKYFTFKGISTKYSELPIDVTIVEKNYPDKLCGAFQFINSAGLTVGGILGCCTYMTKPTKDIVFNKMYGQ